MDFSLYNSLTRQKEVFRPRPNRTVDFYSCGPTVYNRVHVGNLRALLFYDTLFRWLKYGVRASVRWVMNITDVDDKTIRGALQESPELEPLTALQKFTRFYENLFFTDLAALNIPKSAFFQIPRATEAIPAMQDLIQKIAQNGFAYEKDGSVYFSVTTYAAQQKYGKLVNLDLSALKTGTRTLADEIEKENVQDFVLWKGRKAGEPFWNFSFSGKELPGRPGWHIECSAMAKEAFGEFPFDIHAGGVDLKFPHHEDEIAQSVAGYGQESARFWAHNEHLLIAGEKMSKSLGNFYTLEDLLKKGHKAESIRFFLVSNHYRTKLNLTEEGLEAAQSTLQRIRNALTGLGTQKNDDENETHSTILHDHPFVLAMHDDLNTPQAVAALFAALDQKQREGAVLFKLFRFAEKVLGVRFFPLETVIPEDVMALAQARQEAKRAKDFIQADILRKTIGEKGFEVRDTATAFEILPREQ